MISISLTLVTTLIATVQSQSCTTASECSVDQYCDTTGSEGTCQYAFCSNGDCSAYQDLPFCDNMGYCNPNCTITDDYCPSIYNYDSPCIPETGLCETTSCLDAIDFCDIYDAPCMAETGLCEPESCFNVVDWCPEYQICNTQDGSCFNGDCSSSDCSAYPTHPICDNDYCLPDCNTVSGEFCYNTWGLDYAFCDPTGQICMSGATCVTTPTLCDSISVHEYNRDVTALALCNVTSETCIFECTTNLQCQNWFSLRINPDQVYSWPYPETYCNITSGECIHGCTEVESGCDGYYDFYLNEFGGYPRYLFNQLYCNTDRDECVEKTCFDSTDCDVSAGFDCIFGFCMTTCSTSSECYYDLKGVVFNGSGVECASPYLYAPKTCLAQKPCSSNDDCMSDNGTYVLAATNRICSDEGYCEMVLCDGNDECESALNNNFASCNLFSDPNICLNNECQIDLDCSYPFDSCLIGMAEGGFSSGYMCYKKCDYDNTTTSDNDACNVFGTDNDGYDIECNIGVAGDEEFEYCDIYNVDYTSCIVDGCEDKYECNLNTLTCDLQTTAPTTQPTENICDVSDNNNKCYGKAKICKKDSENSGSTYSQLQIGEKNDDDWCAWCLCMDVKDNNPLEKCVYYWLKDNNITKKWKQLFAHVAFQGYFLETCFPENCIWNDVKLNDQITGCTCDQFTCGDTTESVGRYNLFEIIVIVLVMVSWM